MRKKETKKLEIQHCQRFKAVVFCLVFLEVFVFDYDHHLMKFTHISTNNLHVTSQRLILVFEQSYSKPNLTLV